MTENIDLISVVIPTHNRAEKLKASLNSALIQKDVVIEVVVVSDGFDAMTDQLMQQYLKRYQNIRYIVLNPAQGANRARNVGIESSRGAYVAFLDDDDEFLEGKLFKQVEEFKKNSQIGLVYTGLVSRYKIGEKYYSYNVTKRNRGNLSKQILFSNVIGSTSTVMIRKDILLKERFDERLLALQDHDLWIRICQRHLVSVVTEPLLIYNSVISQDSSVQISSSIEKHIQANKLISDKYADLYEQLSDEDRKLIENNNQRVLANKYFRTGNTAQARKIYKENFFKHKRTKDLLFFLSTFFNYKYSVIMHKYIS